MTITLSGKDNTLATKLGHFLADYEFDFDADPSDTHALEAISFISATYRNFVNADFPNFREDFEAAYARRKEVVWAEHDRERAARRAARLENFNGARGDGPEIS